MSKHVKLYEAFQNERSLEELKIHMITEQTFRRLRRQGIDFSSIRSRRLYEQADTDANDELYNWLYQEVEPNVAELRAANRGNQILSRLQLAALYLFAMGSSEEGINDPTEYIQVIPGMGNYNFQGLPKYQLISFLASLFGIDSDTTFTRTANKFANHITGGVEDPEVLRTEVDSRKIKDAYEFLSRFGKNDVALALGDAIQGDAQTADERVSQAEKKQAELYTRTSARKEERREESIKIGNSIYQLRSDISRAFPNDMEKISRYVWRKAAEKNPSLSYNEMWDGYLAYLKDKNLKLRDYPLNRPPIGA